MQVNGPDSFSFSFPQIMQPVLYLFIPSPAARLCLGDGGCWFGDVFGAIPQERGTTALGTATFNPPVHLLGSPCLLPLTMHGEFLHFFLLQWGQTPNKGRVSRQQWALVPKGHTCIKATWEAQEMVLGVFLGVGLMNVLMSGAGSMPWHSGCVHPTCSRRLLLDGLSCAHSSSLLATTQTRRRWVPEE